MAGVLDPTEAASQGRDQTEERVEIQTEDTATTTDIATTIVSASTAQHQQDPQLEIPEEETAETCNPLVDDNDESEGGNAVTTDILQQAFVEASGGEITHIDDEEEQQHLCLSPDKQQLEDLAASVDHQVGSDVVGDVVTQQSNFDHTTALPNIVDDGTSGTFASAEGPIQPTPVAATDNTNGTFASINPTGTLVTSNPLGSKGNPIRIIQQGNTYKSTQKLSQDQIQQIVQVLQKQNLAAKTVNGGPTAVYNPETNTRIVYRIVQPHEKASATGSTGVTSIKSSGKSRGALYPGRARGRPKKRQRTQSESSVSDEASEPPFDGESDSEGGDMSHLGGGELSPTEKLRKKREKPRTRSGRVSKPPSHMVKDYKQIHRVDWYEDYDDDDGGYSDIYDSGNEERTSQQSENVESKKKFGCSQCEKTYVGVKSLARHYKMTGHGDPTELLADEETSAKVDAADNADTAVATDTTGTPGLVTAGVSKSKVKSKPKRRAIEDGAWRPPTHVKAGDPGKPGRPSNSEQNLMHPLDGPGPGRPPMTFWERRVKRMEKLKAALSAYSCTEVLQSIAPRLKKDQTSLYDVMNAGLATASEEQRPSYTCMLQLYTELQSKMTELARNCLRPLLEGESVAEDKEAIQIVTEVIAHSIGIEPGLFEVSDLPKTSICMPAVADNSSTQPTDKEEPDTSSAAANEDAAPVAADLTEDKQLTLPDKEPESEALQVPMDSEPQAEPPAVDSQSTATAPVEHATANSASAIAEAVSKLMPGDIITLDGQKIVIPDGAHIVQSEEGVIIYASKEPDAACVINLKLGADPGPPTT